MSSDHFSLANEDIASKVSLVILLIKICLVGSENRERIETSEVTTLYSLQCRLCNRCALGVHWVSVVIRLSV